MHDKTSLFSPERTYQPSFSFRCRKHMLTDRQSKYTVSWGRITSKDEGKVFMKELLKDRKFMKATHNTYAWRIQLPDGWIKEGKNDDGEAGAGNCVLREMQRASIVNAIVVVTRYFGGIQLHADRFKNVLEVTKQFVEEEIVK